MPLAQYFNSLRSFTGVIDNPMTMGVVKDWQEHTYVRLERWERDCMFAMDRSFRRAYGDVVSFHASRKPVKALMGGGRDYEKART